MNKPTPQLGIQIAHQIDFDNVLVFLQDFEFCSDCQCEHIFYELSLAYRETNEWYFDILYEPLDDEKVDKL